jgi:hypothetical protein
LPQPFGQHQAVVSELLAQILVQVAVAELLAGVAEVGVHPLRVPVVGAEHQRQAELRRCAVGVDLAVLDPPAGVVEPLIEDQHIPRQRSPGHGDLLLFLGEALVRLIVGVNDQLPPGVLDLLDEVVVHLDRRPVRAAHDAHRGVVALQVQDRLHHPECVASWCT